MKMIKITTRALILFIVPFWVAFYYYPSFIYKTTYTSFKTVELMSAGQDKTSCSYVVNKIEDLKNTIEKVREKEKEINSLLGLPGNLFGYDLWAKNNSLAKTTDNKNLNLIFNVVIQNYEKINFGEDKKIAANLNFDNIPKLDYSFSCFFEDNTECPKEIKLNFIDENNSSIDFYLRPTFLGSVIMFLFGLTFFYGFLLLVANSYKFIFKGKPFVEK